LKRRRPLLLYVFFAQTQVPSSSLTGAVLIHYFCLDFGPKKELLMMNSRGFDSNEENRFGFMLL